MAEEQLTVLEECTESLKLIQEFKAETLERPELGGYEFAEVVEPANNLINLFRRISLEVLADMPDGALKTIHVNAVNLLANFKEIIDFNSVQDNAATERTNLIEKIKNLYADYFNSLYLYISYSSSVTTDFSRVKADADQVVTDVKTDLGVLTNQVTKTKDTINGILEDVKKAAGELGVTKEAEYFHKESKDHKRETRKWRTRMVWFAGGVGIFSLFSLGMHNIPILKTTNLYETIQLAVSKVLVFGVLSYMLYISARNYLAHTHNQIVNKHRQNSLLTYKALVDAASGDRQNIVLLHAAACIYSPQPTGYSKETEVGAPNTKSLFSLMTDTISDNVGS